MLLDLFFASLRCAAETGAALPEPCRAGGRTSATPACGRKRGGVRLQPCRPAGLWGALDRTH